MTLMEFHADVEQLTFQMKRIADTLELLVPQPVLYDPTEIKKAELHTVQPRGRWEAEVEDRKWRKISEAEASIMPRR